MLIRSSVATSCRILAGSFFLLLMGICGVSLCGSRIQSRSGTLVVGRYTNGDYGYAVTIPKNMAAFRTPPPAPNHGFGMNLSTMPDSYLWVDASYDVLEYPGTIAEWKVQLLRERGASNATIRKQSKTNLGGLAAVRIVIDYELKGAAMMSETVDARRAPKGHKALESSIRSILSVQKNVSRKILG